MEVAVKLAGRSLSVPVTDLTIGGLHAAIREHFGLPADSAPRHSEVPSPRQGPRGILGIH